MYCGDWSRCGCGYITTQQQAFFVAASSFSSRSGTRGGLFWAIVGGGAAEVGDVAFERCICGVEGIVGVIL